MNLTEHFTAEEMGYYATPAQYQPNVRRVAYLLEEVRAAAGGGRLKVTSVWRTPEHNEAVGGVANSKHLTAEAADFEPLDVSVDGFLARFQAAQRAGRAPAFGQLEVDPQDGHVHISLARSGSRFGEILLALPNGTYQTIAPGTVAVGAGVVLLGVLGVAWWTGGRRLAYA